MMDKKVEQPDSKEKKLEAKKVVAGGKVKKGNLRAEMPRRGGPTPVETLM